MPMNCYAKQGVTQSKAQPSDLDRSEGWTTRIQAQQSVEPISASKLFDTPMVRIPDLRGFFVKKWGV